MVIVGSFLCATFAAFTNLRKVFNFTLMVLYSFRGFRLGGSDSDLEIEHKKVAELVYNKEYRKRDHNIIKSWFARHWKSVAILAGWLIGLYLFFAQLPL